MSSNTQRTSKEKPRSLKCRHFCLPFDNHNYCPPCREANRGDNPCVTVESLCSSFSDEQMLTIKNRKHYVRKQKADTSKDDELDLLGDEDVESFTGSQATLRVLLTIYLLLGLDDKKGQQELRPRGPSSMLPLGSDIKDTFDKFEHDFLSSNLPEGKYIKPPPSTESGTRWDSLVMRTKTRSWILFEDLYLS